MNKIDKKVELTDLMKRYVDEDNCIDIAQFHVENQKAYSLLPHYFGSVNNAIADNGWIKITRPQHIKINTVSLSDQLAYDMLETMRNKGMTYEQIAGKYGVSKAAISQRHKALQKATSKAINNNIDN